MDRWFRRRDASLTAVFVLVFATIATAQQPNFSGRWEMSPARSRWNGMPAPDRVDSTIVHDDPTLKVATSQSGRWGG
jgi:hypothetical protein